MRFMIMVIPEGYESAAPDAVPLAGRSKSTIKTVLPRASTS